MPGVLLVLLAILGCPRGPTTPNSPVQMPTAPRWEPPPPPVPSHVGGWYLFGVHDLEDEVLVHVDLLGEDVGDLVALGRSSGLEPQGVPEAGPLAPGDHELTRRLIHGYLGGAAMVDLWAWTGAWKRGVPAAVERVELAESPTGRAGIRVWLRPVDARNPALRGPGWGITRMTRGGDAPRGAPGTLDPACASSPVLEIGGIEGQPACWSAPLEPGMDLAATLWTGPEQACTILGYAGDGETQLLAPLCRDPAMVPLAWTADVDQWIVVLQERGWRALALLPSPGDPLEPSAWSRRPR